MAKKVLGQRRLIIFLCFMVMGYGCAFQPQGMRDLEDAGRINDQNKLADIAISDTRKDQRKTAVEKITDQNLLARVALLSDEEISLIAIEKISDQKILADVIIQNRYKLFSKPMIERITDQEALADIALKAGDSEAGRSAVEKLSDQPVLANLVIEKDLSEEMRMKAIGKLNDQQLLAKLITDADFDLGTQEVIFRKINDPQLLVVIALSARPGNTKIGVNAAQQIADQSDLFKIVMESQNIVVRRVAYLKLNDPTLLARLAKEPKDPAVRIATALRLGRTTWKEVVGQATQNKLYSGDVIGAMVLAFSDPVMKESLVPVFSAYFKKGDPSRLPELVFLLNLYGTKALAEDYLYCGKDELRTAGEKWLESNGMRTYPSKKGKVSHRLRWGRGK